MRLRRAYDNRVKGTITIRPMKAADVPGSVGCWREADLDLRRRLHLPAATWTDELVTWTERRVAFFLATDQAGSWVADDEGTIVAMAQAHAREGLWVLAHLFVIPAAQSKGLGGALFRRAVSLVPEDSPGLIMSSPDPRAIRVYAAAGFALHPAVAARGRIQDGSVLTVSGIRSGAKSDLDWTASVDRLVRGAGRPADLALALAQGDRILVAEERGYVVFGDSGVTVLAALDPRTAAHLLAAALATTYDRELQVGRITAAQQWSIPVLLAAGLQIRPQGPVMVRGHPAPLTPYLPDGTLG